MPIAAHTVYSSTTGIMVRSVKIYWYQIYPLTVSVKAFGKSSAFNEITTTRRFTIFCIIHISATNIHQKLRCYLLWFGRRMTFILLSGDNVRLALVSWSRIGRSILGVSTSWSLSTCNTHNTLTSYLELSYTETGPQARISLWDCCSRFYCCLSCNKNGDWYFLNPGTTN